MTMEPEKATDPAHCSALAAKLLQVCAGLDGDGIAALSRDKLIILAIAGPPLAARVQELERDLAAAQARLHELERLPKPAPGVSLSSDPVEVEGPPSGAHLLEGLDLKSVAVEGALLGLLRDLGTVQDLLKGLGALEARIKAALDVVSPSASSGKEDELYADRSIGVTWRTAYADASTAAALALEAVVRHGHTHHCASRQAYGDGECECGTGIPSVSAPATATSSSATSATSPGSPP